VKYFTNFGSRWGAIPSACHASFPLGALMPGFELRLGQDRIAKMPVLIFGKDT
jgi:hypothetical protein